MEQCDYHTKLVADIAVIKNDIEYIKNSVVKHIKEGEEPGGFRDRLLILEGKVDDMTKLFLLKLVSAAVLGGIVSDAIPETLHLIVKFILKQ